MIFTGLSGRGSCTECRIHYEYRICQWCSGGHGHLEPSLLMKGQNVAGQQHLLTVLHIVATGRVPHIPPCGPVISCNGRLPRSHLGIWGPHGRVGTSPPHRAT